MIYRTLALAATATLVSTGAFAQSAQALSDQDYCYELSNLYRAYARFNQVNVAAADAMAACDKGDPKGAIATLSNILTANKITLPKQKP
jgi:hypothetical protein